jgi:haloacetate dehalogenase
VAPRLDQKARLTVGATSYLVATGGDGTPLLLLHGFPETHVCWRHIAPALATSHSIVAPDLKGYGASEAPAGGPKGEGYSKREMAGELVELMGAARPRAVRGRRP